MGHMSGWDPARLGEVGRPSAGAAVLGRRTLLAQNNDSYIVFLVVPEARACARRSNGRVGPIGGYVCVRRDAAVHDKVPSESLAGDRHLNQSRCRLHVLRLAASWWR